MQLITTATNPSAPPGPQLSKLAKRKGWQRIYRGVYVDAATMAAQASAETNHAARVLAAAAALPGAVVSHASAAVLHGLPLLRSRVPSLVHVTRKHSASTTQWVVTHRGHLEDHEITEVAGVRCTSMLRTLRDLANLLAPHELLAAGDSAIRALGSLRGIDTSRYNRSRMRWLREHANGRAERFGESWSRYALLQAGVELPMLQPNVYDEKGNWLARPDFASSTGVLGEFDGQIKYHQLLRPGETASDAIMREKRREERLREAGHEIVRWDWRLLQHPEKLARRWQLALEKAALLPAPKTKLVLEPLPPIQRPDWTSIFTWHEV